MCSRPLEELGIKYMLWPPRPAPATGPGLKDWTDVGWRDRGF